MAKLPRPELLAILSILRGTGRQSNDPSTSATAFIISGFQRTGLAGFRNTSPCSGWLGEAPPVGVLNWLGNAPFGFAISPAGCLILDSIMRGRWARSSTKRYPQATFRIPGRHFGEKFSAGGEFRWIYAIDLLKGPGKIGRVLEVELKGNGLYGEVALQQQPACFAEPIPGEPYFWSEMKGHYKMPFQLADRDLAQAGQLFRVESSLAGFGYPLLRLDLV